MRRVLSLLMIMMVLVCRLAAQVFVGPDIGGAYGRTLELGMMAYPKNEDWIAGTLGVGYTFGGPMYFPRKRAECLSGFHNSGWHVRAGVRNGLTTDHHENHIFWGADLTYSRQHERATLNTCDTASLDPLTVSQSLNIWSAGLNAGYTWNPLRRQSIYQKFLIDFGLRMSFPFHNRDLLLGDRDYVSGAGFTWFPIRSIAFNPIVCARWELFHGRDGYSKGRTVKRFK